MNYIAILGRQPEFGLAELESLLGASAVTPLPNGLALISGVEHVPYERFGSVIKFARVYDEHVSRDTASLTDAIQQLITTTHPLQPGVKLKVGLSDYAGMLSANSLNKIGLSVKKVLKQGGYSVRIVPNKSAKLGSAQIIHNSLVTDNGIECLVFKNGSQLQLATTVYEQNIEAYTARDQARPMRDARVGMLPPKLAQTIINLATGPYTHPTSTLLDPFCGTGVILQEAALMGYRVYGTDLEERMIRYSRENLEWLKATHHIDFASHLKVGDATSHNWQQPIDFVAAETYLGRPLTAIPSKNELMDLVQSVNTLHKRVLVNLHSQLAPNTRLCLAVPAWRTGRNTFTHLPVINQLDTLGFERIQLSHVTNNDLLYYREDQIVARELLILVRT